MYVSSREGRAKINKMNGQVSINIPSTKNIFVILFLCAWLGGWFFGETSAIKQVFGARSLGSNLFMLFWLCGWTIGGGFVIFTVLWSIAGNEHIAVGHGIIKIKKTIFGVGLSREYTLSVTRDFRVVRDNNSYSFFNHKRRMNFFGGNDGTIAFDYGMKTVNFGLGIDAAEAKYILEILSEKGLIKGFMNNS
ncbi:hypothetical protein [Pelosinus sp. IPA-1]|uniref:hypothetical protein n=1 Tax=Pelosinus sp. IPA-1 TaxID=3029569 RepID=UPI0024362259|nr:hypothetical protein [Pelosinus sp. IPA-1]GMA99474.1 hypothetical protein PIPA1_22740 [Pelosinus sp. IPA-1]